MPERIIRPGIRTSERTAKLIQTGGWFAGVFYAWLLTLVDDFGRYDARPVILRTQMFPFLLDQVTEQMISDAIRACVSAGLLHHYIADGKPFIEIIDFRQRFRAVNSKFPDPQGNGKASAGHPHADVTQPQASAGGGVTMPSETETETNTELRCACSVPDAAPAPVAALPAQAPLSARKKSKPAKKPPADEPSGFVRFMDAWPKHHRKPSPGSAMRVKCRQLWDRKKLEPRADEVLAGLGRWKRSAEWAKEDGRFIPGPHPWLNDLRFMRTPPGAPDDDDHGFVRKFDPELADRIAAQIREKQASEGTNGSPEKT